MPSGTNYVFLFLDPGTGGKLGSWDCCRDHACKVEL